MLFFPHKYYLSEIYHGVVLEFISNMAMFLDPDYFFPIFDLIYLLPLSSVNRVRKSALKRPAFLSENSIAEIFTNTFKKMLNVLVFEFSLLLFFCFYLFPTANR